ncbi:hypothetical protein [Devosia sp.]|uniref:hypothetical protein n=1 Tax=Devosia sp. TaxID=1871048 RepID=UPI003F719B26
MSSIYGRFSIGCWEDPSSVKECDAEEYFDDRLAMANRAERLLRGGRFKSIVTYEWNAVRDEWDELDELTLADLT